MTSAEALRDILQRAYSGELTAALAYRGHWISLRKDEEIQDIRRIEAEEWAHRRRIGEMLEALGSGPRPGLEAGQALLGAVICIGCNMVGWFIPMYFAGRLEAQNDQAYEDAAGHAAALGLWDLAAELKGMAQVERDHEAYFLAKVMGHPALPFSRRIFHWGPGDPAEKPAEGLAP